MSRGKTEGPVTAWDENQRKELRANGRIGYMAT